VLHLHAYTLVTFTSALVQGVVKALFDQGLLPKVLSGSSVGSISASLSLLLKISAFSCCHICVWLLLALCCVHSDAQM
jgi:hypothetical protein